MKLAEALLLRADLQKKSASLRERIAQNAIVQKGDRPHEDPDKLLREAYGVLSQLEDLIFDINDANLKNKLNDGRTMTQALAQRDCLVMRHSLLISSVTASSRKPDRYGEREIKWVSVLDVAKLQKQADDLAREIRELNAAIQEANWRIDIKD